MDLACPVLPSQHYSPSVEYCDDRHTRQPLRDATSPGGLPLCFHGFSGLTPPSSTPAPPVVPTQSLDSHYGVAGSLRQQLQRRQRHGINPIYLSPQFQAYRKKQAEKNGKTAQIWPDVLEDAFLDGEWRRARRCIFQPYT